MVCASGEGVLVESMVLVRDLPALYVLVDHVLDARGVRVVGVHLEDVRGVRPVEEFPVEPGQECRWWSRGGSR